MRTSESPSIHEVWRKLAAEPRAGHWSALSPARRGALGLMAAAAVPAVLAVVLIALPGHHAPKQLGPDPVLDGRTAIALHHRAGRPARRPAGAGTGSA